MYTADPLPWTQPARQWRHVLPSSAGASICLPRATLDVSVRDLTTNGSCARDRSAPRSLLGSIWLWFASRQLVRALAGFLKVHPQVDQTDFLATAATRRGREERSAAVVGPCAVSGPDDQIACVDAVEADGERQLRRVAQIPRWVTGVRFGRAC